MFLAKNAKVRTKHPFKSVPLKRILDSFGIVWSNHRGDLFLGWVNGRFVMAGTGNPNQMTENRKKCNGTV